MAYTSLPDARSTLGTGTSPGVTRSSRLLSGLFLFVVVVFAVVTSMGLSTLPTWASFPGIKCSMELPLTLPLRLLTTCVAHHDTKRPPSPDIPHLVARLESLEAQICNRVSDINIIPTTMSKPRNFALHASGARILPDLTSPTYLPERGSRIWEWARGYYLENVDILTPDVVLGDQIRAGSCWAFSGSTGNIGISLAERVLISEITIDHIRSAVATSSHTHAAPQSMTLWGQLDSGREDTSNRSASPMTEPAACTRRCFSLTTPSSIQDVGVFLPIAKLHYDMHATSTFQSFAVSELQPDSQTSFRVVVLQVHSNWGGNSTCLSSVGVHGEGES